MQKTCLFGRMAHCIVHYMMRYTVHYMVHYVVHFMMHGMVHYISVPVGTEGAAFVRRPDPCQSPHLVTVGSWRSEAGG